MAASHQSISGQQLPYRTGHLARFSLSSTTIVSIILTILIDHMGDLTMSVAIPTIRSWAARRGTKTKKDPKSGTQTNRWLTSSTNNNRKRLAGEKNPLQQNEYIADSSSSLLSSIVKQVPVWSSAIVGTIYVVYPTSMLLLFRISEQISWSQLFQHYHTCRVNPSKFIPECFKLVLVQLTQLAVTVGTFWYFFQLNRSRGTRTNDGWFNKFIPSSFGRGVLYYGLFWITFITTMRLSVDGWDLYKPSDVDPTVQALESKVAVVTGANRGIGLATAEWLASHGAHVVITCRSLAKCQPVADMINQRPEVQLHNGVVTPAELDLSDLESAYNLTVRLADEFPNGIHYIFCNAGTTPQYPLSKGLGLEDGFGGMHLAHMTLVLGLLPSLRMGAERSLDGRPSRVIMVSSEMSINACMGVLGEVDDMFDAANLRGERVRGDGTLATSMPAYGRAKLCNTLFAMELNRRMKEFGWPIVANAVHTGAVVTDSSRNSIKKVFEYGKLLPGLSWLVSNVYFPLLWRDVEGGARTLLCAALSEEWFVAEGGQYLDALCRPFMPDSADWRESDYSPLNKLSIPLGQGKTIEIFLDPVQSLMVADQKYSKWLFDVSLELIETSPASPVTRFATMALESP